MANLKQTAQEYEPLTTKNIAELERVSTNLEVTTKTFKEGTSDEFTINVINVDGSDYRVPATVFADLKAILEITPELEFFRVKKQGVGLGTSYTVIPL